MSNLLTNSRPWARVVLVAGSILLGATHANAVEPSDEELLIAGKRQFNKCQACHTLDSGQHLAGPSLAGLFGRQAGSLPDFRFSPALEQADFVWDEQNLSAFIENPMTYLPGVLMPFGGMKKEAQRRALIAYLRSTQP